MTAAMQSPPGVQSPMMAQYLALKAEAGAALLLFRMGDFYELFLEDAATAAHALDIALTHRGQHEGQPLPMCGVPVHSHEAYLARLVKAGHAVAVAEQVESPAEARKRGAKSVVARAIVRIITPGTLTEERLLEGGRANWLMAGFPSGASIGLAWADISTGALHLATIPASALPDELARIAPAELLWPENAAPPQAPATLQHPSRFDSRAAIRTLAARFAVATLDGFGQFAAPALAAANALVAHLADTARGTPIRLDPPRAHSVESTLAIDAATRRSLEITTGQGGGREGSLLATIDRTVTAAGARLLAAELASPLTDVAAIDARLDCLQWLLGDSPLRRTLRDRLRAAPDIARALARISAGRESPRDLAALRDGLAAAAALEARLATATAGGAPAALVPLLTALAPPQALLASLSATLAESPPANTAEGAIAEGFDPALDELRLLAKDTRIAIASLEATLRAETGMQALKIRHNNVIGYHLEAATRSAEPLLANPAFAHRQTLAGVMRFDTEALRTLASRIAQAQAHSLAAEAAHLEDLRQQAVAEAPAIATVAHALAALDRSAALAELAEQESWCRPRLTGDVDFAITAGRHPVVQAARRHSGEAFVANDCRLENSCRLWLVTGPNMGGKSTFLRQNALIAILAQAGSFVPAAQATIGIVDRLYSRVGAADSLAEGRSTFMVEMVETAAILNGATARSLLLLDEVGRGTSTWDGLAIAWSILEAIHDGLQARCLFASHYHELTALKPRLPHLALRTMRVREWKQDLVFLHEVAEGSAPGSFGLQVARLAGLPANVLARAGEILRKLEAGQLGNTARNALADLPLFNVAPPPAPRADALTTRLAEIHPDTLTPRAALDLLYELKELSLIPQPSPGQANR